MKYIVFIATVLVTNVAWALANNAWAQESPPPIYAGVDSIGAKPNPQDESPPIFFEAKASWPSLGIAEPRTAWEFAQRGMYKQDELGDVSGGLEDFHRALELDSHLLIARARIGTILLTRAKAETSSTAAINLIDEAVHEFEEVILEQPHRGGMHLKVGDLMVLRYRRTSNIADADEAINAYRAELAMAPQSQPSHYALAFLLSDLGRTTEARMHVERYLALAVLHSDPYPYKILAAERLRQSL